MSALQYWIWLSSVEGVGVKRFYQLLSLFEDARSVVARLQLVGEYSLAGISIWTADKVYRPGLYVLQSMYSVEKLL